MDSSDVKKENGGKFTAQWLAYNIAGTPYVTEIDSDDILFPDAILDFEKTWTEIELSGVDDIVKVSMFAVDGNDAFLGVGNYNMPHGLNYYDATWQQMVLKDNCHKELVSSVNRSRFLETIDPERYQWGIGKFLDESIIWSALSRTYRTRLLNKKGRKVNHDANNSILRNGTSIQTNNSCGALNKCANSLYFIDENISFFYWNPRYFLGHYRRMIKNAKKTGVGFKELKNHFHSAKARTLLAMVYYPFRLF